jgi:hypothetical protein
MRTRSTHLAGEPPEGTKEEAVKVKNINATSEDTCRCGSWLEHWKKFSGQALPTCCPEEKCPHKPEVGAFVQKDSHGDPGWYIVPLCKLHNELIGKSLILVDTVKLVSANAAGTCGTKGWWA